VVTPRSRPARCRDVSPTRPDPRLAESAGLHRPPSPRSRGLGGSAASRVAASAHTRGPGPRPRSGRRRRGRARSLLRDRPGAPARIRLLPRHRARPARDRCPAGHRRDLRPARAGPSGDDPAAAARSGGASWARTRCRRSAGKERRADPRGGRGVGAAGGSPDAARGHGSRRRPDPANSTVVLTRDAGGARRGPAGEDPRCPTSARGRRAGPRGDGLVHGVTVALADRPRRAAVPGRQHARARAAGRGGRDARPRLPGAEDRDRVRRRRAPHGQADLATRHRPPSGPRGPRLADDHLHRRRRPAHPAIRASRSQ
jgi:hypothetical protein